ncbi:MAG TPA: chloramphenicol phosphotransferase CPT family protein [Candidatus Stackebrandtia faecavium]|nr:chloramphenicol phosphotransferase CPT family protein [Candidatus Stackebrandtia faecavium]
MNGFRPLSGRIIFLNGASSSGKTSIARRLLTQFETPFFHMSVDDINALRSVSATANLTPEQLEETMEKTVRGFHRAIVGMAEAGNDVIVDHVLRERSWLRECVTLFKGCEVTFVGVRCSLDELERRESTRGDRRRGQAAFHYRRVHWHRLYDVECDTSIIGTKEAAERIREYVDNPHAVPTAFEELRSSYVAM